MNIVPSKAVPNAHFEMWTGKRPSFDHFHVWGCRAKARFYNPNEKKLDSKSNSCFFIGYSEKSKDFKFYYPQSHTIVQETYNAVFIEYNGVSNLV